MQISEEEITNGSRDGEIVYVTHFNPNLDQKATRDVKPTKVMVCSNDAYPTKSAVHYSHSHFRKLKANGEPSSTVIKVYDNTGYRSYTGVPLHIFDNMDEAIMDYQESVQKFIGDLEEAKVRVVNNYDKRIEEMNTRIHEIEGLRE